MIMLKYFLESDEIKLDGVFIDIGFYKVYDFNIVFFYNNLIVRKMNGEVLYGICFIN